MIGVTGVTGTVGRWLVPLIALLFLPAGAAAQEEGGYDYPETATSPATADSMLRLAGVTAADTVYDLGSGDGRIVIRAAERYGATGVGIEIDADLVAEARRRAREAGVEDRVRFVEGNFFRVNLRPATVVTTYLLPETMSRLAPYLLRELRPGTRIVSHDFDIDAWPADSLLGWWDGSGGRTTLFRWVVPARVGGSWALRLSGDAGGTDDTIPLRIDQNFQRLRAGASGGDPTVREARITGDSVRLTLAWGDGRRRLLTGTASLSRMEGRTERGGRWTARRTAFSDSSLVAWSDSAGVGSP